MGIRLSNRTRHAIVAGFGASVAICTVAGLAAATKMPWIMAPFGSTAAIMYGVPGAHFAKPHRVVLGHLLSMSIGIGMYQAFGSAWWSLGLAVGLAIGSMLAFDIFHPPAGASPLLALVIPLKWSILLMPVLAGSIVMVLVAEAYHFVRLRLEPDDPDPSTG
ncbi:MAG: HPP family protein [Fimbriimonas sp.]